jgi:hypothetical protein
VKPSGPISYRRATLEDATALAPNLRKADLAEMALAWSGTPEARLQESIRASSEAWTALLDGKVIALFGLVPYACASAPWMRCADAVEDHPRQLLEAARAWLASVRNPEVPFINAVDSKNRPAIRLIERLGFTVGGFVPDFGAEPDRFRVFFMGAIHV